MAMDDLADISLEIHDQINSVNGDIENVDKMINSLMMLAKSAKTDDEAKIFRSATEAVKKHRDRMTEKRDQLRKQSHGRHNLDSGEHKERSDSTTATSGIKEEGLEQELRTAKNRELYRLATENLIPDYFQDPKSFFYTQGLRGKKQTLYKQFGNIDIGACTDTEKLEEGMDAWVRVNEEEIIKEDESDNDWEALKQMKAQAIQLATELSHWLVHLMFLTLEREKMVTKFQSLACALKRVIEGEKATVVGVFVSLLDMADEELRRMKGLKKIKSLEGNPVTEETQVDGSELTVDRFILQFLHEMMNLELILKHQELAESKMLGKGVLSSLEADLKQELKGIESRVNDMKARSESIFGSKNVNLKVQYGEMELKINELWNQVAQ